MAKLADALERIKVLECPVNEIQKRVAGILEEYDVAGRDAIEVRRDKRFDREGAHAYNVSIQGTDQETIVVMATAGLDDYVAKVVDAYIG